MAFESAKRRVGVRVARLVLAVGVVGLLQEAIDGVVGVGVGHVGRSVGRFKRRTVWG